MISFVDVIWYRCIRVDLAYLFLPHTWLVGFLVSCDNDDDDGDDKNNDNHGVSNEKW